MKKWFRNMPLNGKILFIMIAGILIPFLLLGTIVFRSVYNNTMISEHKFYSHNLKNAADNVDSMLKDYEAVIDSIYDNEEFFKDMAAADFLTADVINVDSSVNMMLGDIRKQREFTAGISYIFPDGSRVSATSGYGNFEEIAIDNLRNMDKILDMMTWEKSPVVWEAGHQEEAGFFSGTKVIRNIYHKNKMSGAEVIHISTLALDNLASLENCSTEGTLAILDGKGRLLWCRGNEDTVDFMMNQGVFSDAAYKRDVLYEYEENYFIYENSKYSGWKYVNIISKSEMMRQADTFKSFFVIIIFVLIFFFIVCAYLVRKSVVYPIKKLIVAMDHVDHIGKIGEPLAISQEDEIGCLYHTYNRMNQRIDSLIAQLTEAMIQDKEKEIKLMHSQLNPHFIYNTLESISWVAYENGVSEISEVVISLSEILKYSIKHSDEYVTFGDEIRMLKNYIYIQKFRFEDRFVVGYEIDEALLAYKTIKFTFQPFVENALVHGFKDMGTQGVITIRLYAEEEDIYAEIEDNGCGMDELCISKIDEIKTSGIGIHNVNKSLQLRFGNQYKIEVSSVLGKGTLIRLRIPKMKL